MKSAKHNYLSYLGRPGGLTQFPPSTSLLIGKARTSQPIRTAGDVIIDFAHSSGDVLSPEWHPSTFVDIAPPSDPALRVSVHWLSKKPLNNLKAHTS